MGYVQFGRNWALAIQKWVNLSAIKTAATLFGFPRPISVRDDHGQIKRVVKIAQDMTAHKLIADHESQLAAVHQTSAVIEFI